MKALLIALGVLTVYALASLSVMFSFHILHDPLNTGYLHLGAGAVCVLAAAACGYAIALFMERA